MQMQSPYIRVSVVFSIRFNDSRALESWVQFLQVCFSTHEPYYKRQVLKRDGLISDPTRVQHAQNGMIVQHGRRHRIDQRRISIIYVLANMEAA